MSGYYPPGVTQDDIDRAAGSEEEPYEDDHDPRAWHDDDELFDAVRNCE